MRGSISAAAAIALLAALWSAAAQAADYEAYQRLVERANRLIEATRGASPEALLALRETAVEADLAVIGWLDDFIASPEFETIPPHQQEAARTDRYRWEYNLSVQLIGLSRCDEAASRLHGLLIQAISDAELQARLVDTYEQALICSAQQAQPQLVQVRIESPTPGAQISIDGVFFGAAPITAQLAPGDHRAEITAPGHAAHTLSFTAELPEILVGPVALAELTFSEGGAAGGVDEPSRAPTWYEWTLWGVGAAGIGVAVGTFVTARGREDTVENPPAGFELDDAPNEQAIIDRLDTVAIVAGSIGIVSAAVGLVLFLMDDEEPVRDASGQVSFLSPAGIGFRF